MVEYYDAHCTKCGESTKADRLAFDFGELINKAITKAANRRLGANTKWETMLGLDFCLYYTWRDLASMYKLQGGKFSKFEFSVEKLRFQLQRFARAKFEDLVEKDIDTLEYNSLIQHIKYVNQRGQDIDFQQLATDIKEVVNLCSKQMSPDDNEVIAKFDVMVVMDKDDRGNEFAKKMMIRYEDGVTQSVTNNVCPNCGKKFYPEVGKHEEIIVGMAGSARVGKTAYLAALVDNLIKQNRKNQEDRVASVTEARNDEWEFFKKVILEKFRNGEKIDKTAFEGGGETIPLFSIEINVLGRSYIFTFIDMPGEAFDNPRESEEDVGVNFIINKRRIINYAEIMWFCVAPEQIDADIARMRRITNLQQDEVNTRTSEVMSNIKATIDAVNMGTRMDAAVMVTMSDQIMGNNEGLFDPNVDVCEEYITSGCLDYEKTIEFCERSKRYLDQAGEIVNALDHMFRRYSVFAVAAYGKNLPQATADELILLEQFEQQNPLAGNGAGFTPTPSMVELPFLWTLAALGKIAEVRQVQQFETRRKFPFGPKEEVYVGDKSVQVPDNMMFQKINEG